MNEPWIRWVNGLLAGGFLSLAQPVLAQEQRVDSTEKRTNRSGAATQLSPSESFDLDPKLIESSPVLQRWLKKTPNVSSDIKNDPSFRTRIRLGYAQFPSSNQASGFNIGIQDVMLDRTRLAVSADYQTSFNGQRQAWGSDLCYFLRPLGSHLNVAPVVGYRQIGTRGSTIEGANLGIRVLLVTSRGGGADISFTQSWISPFSEEEVGLSTLSLGYAITAKLRLSTDFQQQNSRLRKDSRIGIVLEWML